VDVEEVSILRTGNGETVADSGRRSDPGSGACSSDVVADREVDLTFEDVERVGVVLVDVGLDRPETRLAPELEHLELAALVLDVELAQSSGKLLALAGA